MKIDYYGLIVPEETDQVAPDPVDPETVTALQDLAEQALNTAITAEQLANQLATLQAQIGATP